MHISGRYAAHQKGTQKNPIFSCFFKFYPPKGSKIQIRPRNDSTQCGTRFFDVESARVTALEVPDPMRDRVTEKKVHDFPHPKWRRWSDRGQTSPVHHKVGTVFLKLKFIKIGSSVPEII